MCTCSKCVCICWHSNSCKDGTNILSLGYFTNVAWMYERKIQFMSSFHTFLKHIRNGKECSQQLTISITAAAMLSSKVDWFKIDAVSKMIELIIWILSVFWSEVSVVMSTMPVRLLKISTTLSTVMLTYKVSNTNFFTIFSTDSENNTISQSEHLIPVHIY